MYEFSWNNLDLTLFLRHNEAFLKPVFDTIMKQLKRKHSEIRLSAFQTMKELFERSHQFRLLVLEDLYTILELTLETNNVLLPLPKAAAKRLRTLASETLHQWTKKFGSAYRYDHNISDFHLWFMFSDIFKWNASQ